jgi:hypothetical protein
MRFERGVIASRPTVMSQLPRLRLWTNALRLQGPFLGEEACLLPYAQLLIMTGDARLDWIFRDVIEGQLEEAHWLLAAARPESCRSPSFHKGSAMLLLATIAASSALVSIAKPGHKRRTDRKDFVAWVKNYFPWDHVTVSDDQYRPKSELPAAAAEALYSMFRNPIFHTAGLVHSPGSPLHGRTPIAVLEKIHPRTLDTIENERDIEALAATESFVGGRLLSLEYGQSRLSLDALYWSLRKAIEKYASDSAAMQAVIAHLS